MDTEDAIAEAREQTVRSLLSLILEKSNPVLTVQCLAGAAGIDLGMSLTASAIAARCKVSRQAVSKRMVELCERLGLPPSLNMRSEQSRESYRERENLKIKTLKEKLCRKK